MINTPENAIIYYPPKFRPVTGIVQIIHGMGEHQLRYRAFAEYLAESGYAVVTSDLKGHGNNINRDDELGYIGDNGASRLVGDIHELTRFMNSRFPHLPCFMIGHGMGAVIALAYLKKYDYFLDGLILSGMPQDSGYGFSRLMCRTGVALRGEYHRPRSVFNSVYKTYSSSYSREGSTAAWLSADPEVTSGFDKDPRCGFVYTYNGYMTYFELLDNAYRKGSWIRKRMSLPIRVIAGVKDPVAGSKYKLSRICTILRSQGYHDVESQLLHGMRHDIYNDIGHERTYEYILDLLDKTVRSVSGEQENEQ